MQSSPLLFPIWNQKAASNLDEFGSRTKKSLCAKGAANFNDHRRHMDGSSRRFRPCIVYALAWLIFDRESFNFHSGIALLTLCMMHRDTQAMQAKLDELLHAQSEATNHLARIDDQEPEQIEAHRKRARVAD